MSRIVLFSHREIFKNGITTGPSIRVYEIAKALANKGYKVTIAEKRKSNKSKDYTKNKVKFVSWNKELIQNIKKKYDVAIIQSWNDKQEFLDEISKIPIIVDLYAPVLLEHASMCYPNTKFKRQYIDGIEEFFFDDVMMQLSRVLFAADYYLCANKKQKEYYTGVLNALGIINPQTYNRDLIGIVSYGISSDKFIPAKGFQKNNNEKIIIWPGGVNEWFDVKNTVDAVKELVKEIPNLRLIFVGAQNPFDKQFTNKKYDELREQVSNEKLNSIIRFENWTKFENRNKIYSDTEAVIIPAKKGFENDFSHRTRTIDSIWGETRIIITKNSDTSKIVQNFKLGEVIGAEDKKEIKNAIKEILNTKKDVKKFAIAKKELSWDNIIEPINKFCKKPFKINNEIFSAQRLVNEKQKTINFIEDKNQKATKELIKLHKIVQRIKSQNESLQKEIFNFDKDNLQLRTKIEKQAILIGRFKSSIVYPVFRITSKIGRILKLKK